jgi:hypothetical protein
VAFSYSDTEDLVTDPSEDRWPTKQRPGSRGTSHVSCDERSREERPIEDMP